MNLKLVQQRDNLLGEAIVVNFSKRPEEVLQMIRESYRDNPEMVIQTIGQENALSIGLVTALDRFQHYFPAKNYQRGLKGLVYNFENLTQLFTCLKRAKAMIGDLHLGLEVRALSHGITHKLYVDEVA